MKGGGKVQKVRSEVRSMRRLSFNMSFYFLVAFWSSIAVARALWEFLWHPLTFFHQKKREGEFCKYLMV